MRLLHAAICALFLAAVSISGQQPTSSSTLPPPANGTATTTIYDVDGDVTSPMLIPSPPVEISAQKCKKKNQESNDVRFSLFVNSDGKPRWIAFQHALGNSLDQTALDLVNADRFTPAKRNGEQIAVWQSIDVTFQSCRENSKDQSGFPTFVLISQPAQKLSALTDRPKAPQNIALNGSKSSQPYHIGGGVSAPVPLTTPEAHFSLEARKKKIQGVCLISLIVDAQGMPQNPRVIRSAGYGLDANAVDAIRHYRFKPALKGNFEPVPVMLSIEVNFRLY